MISLIVAYSKNNKVIGINNTIPWHIKEDFIHFKNYTSGKTIVMGEQTFLSIGKPLPNRKNIVLHFDKSFNAPGCEVYTSIKDIIKKYKKREK